MNITYLQSLPFIGSLPWKSYLVGGAVIDLINNSPCNDYDIEVHGCSLDELEAHLHKYGEVKLTGKQFGVLKLSHQSKDFDFSIPRVESTTGSSHRDISVSFQNVSLKQAASRRMLTIAAMMIDLQTGELHDFFNGLSDLQQGIIRHISPTTFKEDPLRPLIIMQYVARKGKTIHPLTIKTCQSMKHMFDTLPKERVFEEVVKLLTKSRTPSIGLRFLVDSQWIDNFPTLKNLIGCRQRKEFHPEGDAWEHTLQTIDHCAQNGKYLVPEEWRLALLIAALLHDTGRPSTTSEDGHSYGHEKVIEPASDFLFQITSNLKLIKKVLTIVRLHMKPVQLYSSRISKWKHLHNEIRLDVLGAMTACDQSGRDKVFALRKYSIKCFKYYKKFGEKPIVPVITGKHLIDIGLTPGPEFSVILKKYYNLQLEGMT